MANARGRQPIGFNQSPSGGSNYPFVDPSDDIKYLLADFFLSFDDLEDEIVFPLKVSWMYGFGTVATSAPVGYAAPSHTHDLVVKDANDLVVFDSTEASIFYSSTWDNRLLILEWQTDKRVLRCTTHTDWTNADIAQGQSRTYDQYIEPVSGELQQDTYFKIPKRVTSITVGSSYTSGKSIQLRPGYNIGVELTDEDDEGDVPEVVLEDEEEFIAIGETPEGLAVRKSTSITLNAEPGLGLGLLSSCGEEDIFLRTFNAISPNEYNNFTLDAEGCIRYHRPVSVIEANPRVLAYAGEGLTSSESKAALSFENDCINCCDCTFFARTYQGVKREWFKSRDVADAANSVKGYLEQDIARWEAQKALREANTLRVSLRPEGDGKISWGVAFCNASSCCLADIKIRLTWLTYVNGAITPPEKRPYSCAITEVEGSGTCEGGVRVTLAERAKATVQTLFVDYADPQGVTTVTGRICFPDALGLEEGDFRVKLHALVWVGQKIPTDDKPCPPLYPMTYDSDVLQVWNNYAVPAPAKAQAQKLSENLYDVSKLSPYCKSCDCE